MARIRSIKPEFWTDAKIVRLSPLARLMFVGSWNFADDYGCLPADAFQLRLRVLPNEAADADELVAELFDAGLLEALQTPDAREFWHVTNWSKHQRVSKPSPSDWGDPTDWKPTPTGTFPESPATLPERSGSVPSGKERNGKEWKGREGSGMELATPEAPRPTDYVWEGFSELFGEPPNDALKRRRGKNVRYVTEALCTEWSMEPANVRSVFDSFTEVGRRAQTWPLHFPDATLTEEALAKHWVTLERAPMKASKGQVREYEREREREARLEAARAMDEERKALES